MIGKKKPRTANPPLGASFVTGTVGCCMGATAAPQWTQMTAASSISLPQWVQYFIKFLSSFL